MGLLTPPTFCRDVACIVGDARLAATLSSALTREGEYVAMVGEPRMGRHDRKAEVLRRCNAMARVGAKVIALIGLSPTAERAFLRALDGHGVLPIRNAEDVEMFVKTIQTIGAGRVLRCRPSDLAQGLLLAKRRRQRLVVENGAPPLPSPDGPCSKHLVVIDDHDLVPQCIAANYAFSIGADVTLIPQREDDLRERVYAEIDDRGAARVRGATNRGLRSLANLKRELAPGLDFPDRRLITFVTRGIPYGFFCPAVPSTHLFSYPQLGEMIVSGIYCANVEPHCLAAVVVDPGSFKESETPVVISALRRGGVVVADVTGERAKPELVRLFMQGYPYDFFFVCSHCGDSRGVRWELDLEDRQGRSRRVVWDEAIFLTGLSFVPKLKKHAEVTQLMRPVSVDGTDWLECDTETRQDVMAAWTRLREEPRAEWPVIATYEVERVADSPAIQVHGGAVLLTMIQLIDVGVSPTVFCNSCVSYYSAAQTLTFAGARAYIGTLAPVETGLAQRLAELMFQTPGIQASLPLTLWAAQQAVFPDPDDRTYVHAGCHFNTIRFPWANAAGAVRDRLLAAQQRWADADPPEKDHAGFFADQIRGFLATLLKPGGQ